jgi:hypothetical protein
MMEQKGRRAIVTGYSALFTGRKRWNRKSEEHLREIIS